MDLLGQRELLDFLGILVRWARRVIKEPKDIRVGEGTEADLETRADQENLEILENRVTQDTKDAEVLQERQKKTSAS